MEHIANQIEMDPIEFRVINFLNEGDTLFFDGPGATYETENPLPDILDQ